MRAIPRRRSASEHARSIKAFDGYSTRFLVCRHEGNPHAETLTGRSGGGREIHCNFPLCNPAHKPIMDTNVARSGTSRSGSPWAGLVAPDPTKPLRRLIHTVAMPRDEAGTMS